MAVVVGVVVLDVLGADCCPRTIFRDSPAWRGVRFILVCSL